MQQNGNTVNWQNANALSRCDLISSNIETCKSLICLCTGSTFACAFRYRVIASSSKSLTKPLPSPQGTTTLTSLKHTVTFISPRFVGYHAVIQAGAT